MKPVIFLLVASFLVISAVDIFSAQTTIFVHENIDYDAHSAAMAGASMAVTEGSAAVLSNPAAAASIKHMQAFIGYRTIMDGVWGSPLVFSRSFDKYGVFSVLICGVSSGDEQVIDEFGGEPVFTDKLWGAQYLTTGLSWGFNAAKNISVGTTLKGLYNRLNDGDRIYSAKGVAIDAGVRYLLMENRFTAGAVIRNAGFVLKSFDDNSYDLPFTVEAGISYMASQLSTLKMALDISKTVGSDLMFEPGIDVAIYRRVLSLRLGFAFSGNDAKEFLKKLGGNENEDYVKTNWNTFCVGLGFNKKIEAALLAINLAVQFKTQSQTPSTIISAYLDF